MCSKAGPIAERSKSSDRGRGDPGSSPGEGRYIYRLLFYSMNNFNVNKIDRTKNKQWLARQHTTALLSNAYKIIVRAQTQHIVGKI